MILSIRITKKQDRSTTNLPSSSYSDTLHHNQVAPISHGTDLELEY
jgi:hypothetical protein